MKKEQEMRYLFHVTPYENTELIIEEGIKANEEGEIFAITDVIVANEIAKSQLFITKYSLFVIDLRGVHCELEHDNVGEFTRSYHRIIKQNHIPAEFVTLICSLDTEFLKPTTWDYWVHKRLHNHTRKQTNACFKLMKWAKEMERKGVLSLRQLNKRVNELHACIKNKDWRQLRKEKIC